MSQNILPAPSVVRCFLFPDPDEDPVAVMGKTLLKPVGIAVVPYGQMIEIVQSGWEVPGVYVSTS